MASTTAPMNATRPAEPPPATFRRHTCVLTQNAGAKDLAERPAVAG